MTDLSQLTILYLFYLIGMQTQLFVNIMQSKLVYLQLSVCCTVISILFKKYIISKDQNLKTLLELQFTLPLHQYYMRAVHKKSPSPSSSQSSSSSNSLPAKQRPISHKQAQFFNNQANDDRPERALPQSESEEDSSDYEQKHSWKKQTGGLAVSAKKQLLSDSQEDKSIEQIQQRIKRLERDLQQRIDKHKEEKLVSPNAAKTAGTNTNKDKQKVEREKKVKQKCIDSTPLSKINITKSQGNNIQQHQSSKRKLEQIKEATPNKQETAKTKNVGKADRHSKGQSRKTEESSKMPIRVVSAKQRIERKNEKKHFLEAEKADLARQLVEAKQKIEQMQKTINQLMQQNKKLREKDSNKKRIKSSEHSQRLKEITGSDKIKLEKELQLLTIIQSLRGKLKKSVARKLNHNNQSSAQTNNIEHS